MKLNTFWQVVQVATLVAISVNHIGWGALVHDYLLAGAGLLGDLWAGGADESPQLT